MLSKTTANITVENPTHRPSEQKLLGLSDRESSQQSTSVNKTVVKKYFRTLNFTNLQHANSLFKQPFTVSMRALYICIGCSYTRFIQRCKIISQLYHSLVL